MNVIGFDAAYSFYPYATFEKRRSLVMNDLSEKDAEALGKYAMRGWTIVSSIWPHETGSSSVSFHIGELRKVCDKYSWTVPLDTTGVTPRPRLSPLSEEFDWDPVMHSSWRLEGNSKGVRPRYAFAHPSIFRFEYMLAHKAFLSKLLPFFRRQGTMEHMKANHLSEEDKMKSWTWCDYYRLNAECHLIDFGRWDASMAEIYEAYAEESEKEWMDESRLDDTNLSSSTLLS
jgi:hypothetical protein